jgi:Xaa-Pro aminopeptidase
MSELIRSLPHPADFPAPPSPPQRARWHEADVAARPARVDRLRARFAAAGIDGYFGLRSEHMRYLTGFRLADGEDRLAGNSGRFIVTADEVVLLADSRYRLQAVAEAPGARILPITNDLAVGWAELVHGLGIRRLGVEAAYIGYQLWHQLQAAAPDVELVEVAGWVEADRAIKEPAEVERIRAACAVADRALASIIRRARAGVTESELALALEWEIRTGGAEALAFPVACLGGPNAALPHGSPTDRELGLGDVLLFDFGAMVEGYRSDMTRTLFVGEPRAADRRIYDLVAAAQRASIKRVCAGARGEMSVPSGREADAAARDVIGAAGHGDHFGHSTGHGIGLATHELPSLARTAGEEPLAGPTVFSVEPGVYLDGDMGVRIEDLVLFDPAAHRCEILTGFPKELLVVGM